MLTPGGIVKILDFGVAALLGSGSNPRLPGRDDGGHAALHVSLSNPWPMPSVLPQTYMHSLACSISFSPVAHRSSDFRRQVISMAHVHLVPPPIRLLRPDVSATVEDLLACMLAKDVDRRPDAAAVYEGLRPYRRLTLPARFPWTLRNLIRACHSTFPLAA